MRNQKLINMQKYGRIAGAIGKIATVAGFAIPIICDTWENYQQGASLSEYIADIVVDVAFTAGVMWACTKVGAVVGGMIGGPPGLVIGLAAGFVTGLAISFATEGYSFGKDEKGNDLTIKKYAQNGMKEFLDWFGRGYMRCNGYAY